MRKLLLATAAVLGGTLGVASLANAQTAAPVPAALPNLATAPFTAVPGPTAGPGTITVRLNARVNFYVQAGSDSGRNPGPLTTATGATTAGNTVVAANTKLANYTFQDYIRLFPGFDGVAANGLKYGGFIEIRQDNAVAPGGGVNGGISGASRTRGQLYVRDNFVYLGTDQLGFLRLGSTWGPTTLFTTGTFENFNDGAWNGDAPGLFTGNSGPTWPFPDVGAVYTGDKAVYLSPQIFGFDFSASFEPSTANVNSGSGNCSYANTSASASGVIAPTVAGGGAGCDATSATTVLGETGRRRNTVELSGRYRGAFGPIGVAVEAGGILSGKVINDATPAAALRYDGLQLFDGGFQVTYGGLAVGGHLTTGRSNGQFSLVPHGAKDSFAWLAGASYAIGPVIVGASYYDYQSAGAKTGSVLSGGNPYVGARNEFGVAAGGTYNFAPGMNIFLAYLYGHRKESGVDLLTGVASTATARVTTHNTTQAQGVSLGTQFRW
jgi:hypothetical protein